MRNTCREVEKKAYEASLGVITSHARTPRDGTKAGAQTSVLQPHPQAPDLVSPQLPTQLAPESDHSKQTHSGAKLRLVYT
jgi:hypothetical protein